MSRTYSAGVVTAYGSAKQGGYAGTYEEFCTALGALADVLEDFEGFSVNVTTLAEGSSATASYSDGVLTLGIPKGDTGATGAKGDQGIQGEKGDKGDTGATGNGIASIAKTGTSGLVDTYTITYTDGTTYRFDVTNGQDGEVTNESLAETLEDYAKIDGYYEEMSVGDAEQLVATQYVEDSEPYLFRTTGGSADVGNREYVDEIVGGTVAWNQLASTNVSDWGKTNQTLSYADGVFTATKNASITVANYTRFNNAVIGHKYFLSCALKTSVEGENAIVGVYDTSGATVKSTDNGTTDYVKASMVVTIANSTQFIGLRLVNGASNGTSGLYKDLIIIDLTQMFGSTIADYIYSLEQATAGAGVAKLKEWGFCNKNYYAYTEPTMIHTNFSAHKTIGFNQWDEEWETKDIDSNGTTVSGSRVVSKNYIPVLPSTSYYATNVAWVYFYDVDKNYISNSNAKPFTTPTNCYYIKFKTSSAYGTTYNNDICINLSWSGYRNGEYEPYVEHTYALDSSLTLRGIPKLDSSNNLYYDGDTYASDGTVTRNTILRAYQSGDESLANAITDGTNTVVYSANASTESAEPYQQVQICDDFGTEEFVSTSIVPVGHNTRYPDNLRDKLQHLPSLAGADGYYMISQQNNSMSLELFRIPKAPTSPDGTYVLKATVSGGTPTYSWVAEE